MDVLKYTVGESRKNLCLVFFVCFLDYSLCVVGLLVRPISQQPNPNSTQYLKIKLSSLTPNQAQLLKFKQKNCTIQCSIRTIKRSGNQLHMTLCTLTQKPRWSYQTSQIRTIKSSTDRAATRNKTRGRESWQRNERNFMRFEILIGGAIDFTRKHKYFNIRANECLCTVDERKESIA